MRPELLPDYDAAIEAILAELAATGAGDTVSFELYLFEPGDSSRAVLEGLGAAARRGAQVRVALDATWASALSRLVERTGTLRGELRALARALPGRFELVRRGATDHAKLLRFLRPAGEPSALFGGMNLGDRFRGWRDFMVRVRGPEPLAAIERARAAGRARAGAIELVANAPAAGVFEVAPALAEALGAPGLTRFRIAMAYLDRTGAALLLPALARGAEVRLLLPRDANVYPQANRRALAWLLGAAPPGAKLAIGLVPGMLHAKALLADGPCDAVAFLGSANLKRNSLRRFGELNALVREPTFVADLGRALDGLAAVAEPVTAPPPFARARAWVEELLG